MKILTYPNKKLRQKAAKVRHFDNELKKTVNQMLETLRQNETGVGLAAPQVGISKRIVVVESKPTEKEQPPIPLTILINPKITKFSQETELNKEGCLSFPGQEFKVTRSIKCTVLAQDLEGKRIRLRPEGLLARICQHEIDHLSGVLVIDKQVKSSRTKLNQVKPS